MATRWMKSIAHTQPDPGIHGQIVDSMSATTDKRTNAPSIRMAMSNGVPAGAVISYDGQTVPDGYRERSDLMDLSQLNDNLSGFKFYPTGTQIVGLVADDSAYTDADGNYIIADSPTGETMIDNVTYKAIASTKDTRGEVGADTGIPFSGGLKNICIVCSGYAGAAMYCTIIDSNGNTNLTNSTSVSSDDTFNVTISTAPAGYYTYKVYAKKAGKYRVINNISTGKTDSIVNASVGQLLATVNGAQYSQYNPIYGIATIQYL